MFHRYLYNKSVSSQIFISKHLSDLKGQYDAKIVYILFRSPFKLAWSISYLVPNIFGFKKHENEITYDVIYSTNSVKE